MEVDMQRKQKYILRKGIYNRGVNIRLVLPAAIILMLLAIFGLHTGHSSKVFASTDPDWTTGTITNANITATSNQIRGVAPYVEVKTNFNSDDSPFKPGYHWQLSTFVNNQWVVIHTSNDFNSNGNIDRECYDGPDIITGRAYHVIFYVNNYQSGQGGYVHGTFWVYAKTLTDCTSYIHNV